MKKVLTIVMAVVMLLSLVGCSTQEAAPAQDEATKEETAANAGVAVEGVSFADNPNLKDGKNVLGICWSNWAAEATQILIADYEAKYKEYGFDELISIQSEGDLETQISQIQDLANQGVDVMIVKSVDPDGIVPAVEAVQAMGIPVIAVDRRINTPLYYSFETANYNAGVDICKYVAAKTEGMDEVKILSLPTNLTSIAVRDRNDGFHDEAAYWPWLNIVTEVNLESSIENCYNAVVDAFKTNPDIKVIVVSGDNYVAPIASALSDIGKLYPYDDPNHVIVCSYDGAPSALKYMVNEGVNDAIANQRFDLFCTEPLKVCQAYLNGEIVDAGENDIKMETPIVTPRNVQTLKDMGILWGYNF